MDAQRKKGILDVCVLAVLKKGPSYGYKIIRDISRCIDISESTLYPILKRLEQNGSLRTYRREYNGRIRKYYELTETGQRRIDVFLEEWDELRTMYLFIEEENRQEPDSSSTEGADQKAAGMPNGTGMKADETEPETAGAGKTAGNKEKPEAVSDSVLEEKAPKIRSDSEELSEREAGAETEELSKKTGTGLEELLKEAAELSERMKPQTEEFSKKAETNSAEQTGETGAEEAEPESVRPGEEL